MATHINANGFEFSLTDGPQEAILLFGRESVTNHGWCTASTLAGYRMSFGPFADEAGLYCTTEAILGEFIEGRDARYFILMIRDAFADKFLRPMRDEWGMIRKIELQTWIGQTVAAFVFMGAPALTAELGRATA